MKALVQVLWNRDVGGVRFVAATEPDAAGMHWVFGWGDAWGHLLVPYVTVGVCDEVFVGMCTDLDEGWRCDDPPIVVGIPLIAPLEQPDVWARRAAEEMEKAAMAGWRRGDTRFTGMVAV